MTKRGKNINLYLMDGEPSGRIKCTLANWTGVAYKIPRAEIEASKDREDLKQSGVYFLFGISEDNEVPVVYVGQAGSRANNEGILYRLQEHKRKTGKDYWNEAVVFTTSNNSFGATEISYLENEFYKLVCDASRYEVKNGTTPTRGNITEEKESELLEFVDNAKVIMGTLGYRIFEPYVPKSINEENNSSDLELFLKRKSKKSDTVIEARCIQTNEGFVVLKGSMIQVIDSDSIPQAMAQRRKNAKIDENNILLKDELFKSPSYAAVFVLGGHVNGQTEWKDRNGVSFKELD